MRLFVRVGAAVRSTCGLLPIVPRVPFVLVKLTVDPAARVRPARVRVALLTPVVCWVTPIVFAPSVAATAPRLMAEAVCTRPRYETVPPPRVIGRVGDTR